MKFTTFRSDKGDCVLLTSSDGKHMLVDGGMRDSYTDHVSKHLNAIREAGERIDVVCVSHIDRDHVFGLLQMLDDIVEWRVHDFQLASGNSGHPVPTCKRPPEIGRFWHNAFHEQVGKNSGPIADMLAADSRIFSASDDDLVKELAHELDELASSQSDAINLSRRIGDKQLNIPLNPEYGEGLMFVPDDFDPLRVGSMNIWVIGPYEEELKELRKEWNEWLEEHKSFLRTIQRKNREVERNLGNEELDNLLGLFQSQLDSRMTRDDIKDFLAARSASQLGNRQKVTTPNLASLMLYIEDGGKTAILTGDGHWKDILEGLEALNKLDANGCAHVDLLKIPHHGSEHNTRSDFCKCITADTYVFCGNGAHHNPDRRVIDAYLESRFGSSPKKSNNAQVDDAFTMIFSSNSQELHGDKKDHMKEVEKQVAKAASDNPGQLKFKFLNADKDTRTL